MFFRHEEFETHFNPMHLRVRWVCQHIFTLYKAIKEEEDDAFDEVNKIKDLRRYRKCKVL